MSSSAATSTTSSPPAASAATATAAATAAPVARPDPGPGSFACGELICQAGAEVCAPKEACGEDWPKPGCVPVAELRSRSFGPSIPGATCSDQCYSWFDTKACDGPGDCPSGQVCCYERSRIYGWCTGGDDGFLDEYECKPARTNEHTPCGTAEICSAKDRKCTRRGSSCVVDPATDVGRCEVPQRRLPRCGAAPCPQGKVCIEWRTDGVRECVADPERDRNARIIECDRGRDCAPDETCLRTYDRQRCALGAVSWAGADIPICQDASDCVGYCKGTATATCHVHGSVKLCECRPRCTRDEDCRHSPYCSTLSPNRYGGSTLELEPFCRKAQRRCDCRDPDGSVPPP